MISAEYRRTLAETHAQFPAWGSGHADRNYQQVMACNPGGRILDYGCGKGELVRRLRANGFDAFGYDPAIPEYSVVAHERYDLCVCFDVLEHVETEYVDSVLAEIFALAPCVLLEIALAPASQLLTDGRNAHLTVRPAEWWLARLPEKRMIRKQDRGHLLAFFE